MLFSAESSYTCSIHFTGGNTSVVCVQAFTVRNVYSVTEKFKKEMTMRVVIVQLLSILQISTFISLFPCNRMKRNLYHLHNSKHSVYLVICKLFVVCVHDVAFLLSRSLCEDKAMSQVFACELILVDLCMEKSGIVLRIVFYTFSHHRTCVHIQSHLHKHIN